MKGDSEFTMGWYFCGEVNGGCWQIVGAPKTMISSLKFSPTMKAQSDTWTFEELNRYISDIYGHG